jgi:site-specific DNA-methyltransferase (adenine-specific)
VYAFVPDLPLDRAWTDAALYERYGLSAAEIAFIESQVAAHDDALFDETGTDEGERDDDE